jgi:hypothetical protein
MAESVLDHLLQNKDGITIVSGACSTGTVTYVRPDGTKVYGADGIGERYAAEMGYNVEYFPADWDKHGQSAGPLRNREMGLIADAGVVFWDGESRGSKNMINVLKYEQKKPCRVIRYDF